jgi:uncharacterized protein YbjT (DUF2867 family)
VLPLSAAKTETSRHETRLRTADGDIWRLSPAFIQPIADDVVAAALAEVATGTPQNAVVEIAGPESLRLTDLARQIFDARKTPGTIVADTHARYFGGQLGMGHWCRAGRYKIAGGVWALACEGLGVVALASDAGKHRTSQLLNCGTS